MRYVWINKTTPFRDAKSNNNWKWIYQRMGNQTNLFVVVVLKGHSHLVAIIYEICVVRLTKQLHLSGMLSL